MKIDRVEVLEVLKVLDDSVGKYVGEISISNHFVGIFLEFVANILMNPKICQK